MNDMVIHYADDDTDDLYLFKKALERVELKASLKLYNNGQDLLNSIKETSEEEAVVFLDINMPGKSGLSVLKEIREDEKLKGMPVVMYSTSTDPNGIMVSQTIGADLYVVKPTSFITLTKLLQKVLTIDWKEFEAGEDTFVLNGLKANG